MTLRQLGTLASSLALAIGLTACGGAGGGASGEVISVPPPAPPPPPPPPPVEDKSVELLASPPSAPLSILAVGDPIQVRYDPAANQYQVLAGGEDWTALIDNPESNQNYIANRNFIFASRAASPSDSSFNLAAHHRSNVPSSQYRYSNLASWSLRTSAPAAADQVRSGIVAFGTPTPQSAVPVSGTGVFQGWIEGVSNFTAHGWGGEFPNAPIAGKVVLVFDFGAGALSGQIQPFLACDCDEIINMPILAFRDTVFGVGSRNFAGRFETALEGPNSFSGLFTGPNAEELIGRWALPFGYDGRTYSAEGGWIAKRTE